MTDVTRSYLFDICVKNRDVLIVDVSNYLHRFMWVHRELSVMVGEDIVNTGHIYGFMRFICFLKNKFPNCSIVLSLDGVDKERKEMNPMYKAQRNHSYRVDRELDEIIQMSSLVGGVYVGYHSDMEADDVIYSVSKKIHELCLKNGLSKEIFIMSNDKDMYQCVTSTENSRVRIIRKFGSGEDWFSGAEIVGYSEARDRFDGVRPENLAKFRAIVGDSSDNLAGYYRFRKSNASVLAENCVVTDSGLIFADGVEVQPKWESWIRVINEDYSRFISNYKIMRLREFDFDLYRAEVGNIGEVVGVIKKYGLLEYLRWIIKYSPYKEEIVGFI